MESVLVLTKRLLLCRMTAERMLDNQIRRELYVGENKNSREAYIEMSMIWDRNSSSRFLSVYFLRALALFLVYSRLEHQVSLVYSSYSLPAS
ncbi:hypothetical protein WN944_023728 [Citrus x changshan-huyou]|uniref:Uncharacterized protein n=1 Tax=Citrus x changshan-huyou TaxID=2935761 RepID=A0AAP0N397_9ROSI